MSLVRLLGFRTLTCGCVIGRYREVATSREVTYVEEKGTGCELHGHRRNHTIAHDRVGRLRCSRSPSRLPDRSDGLCRRGTIAVVLRVPASPRLH